MTEQSEAYDADLDSLLENAEKATMKGLEKHLDLEAGLNAALGGCRFSMSRLISFDQATAKNSIPDGLLPDLDANHRFVMASRAAPVHGSKVGLAAKEEHTAAIEANAPLEKGLRS